ncbi:MAG: sulfotransferase domain-containing protein [Alphaproteobacteria bacterium]|nr:sulfotransferase domain-containing protein [Alphaproteobacteria bacterium]
MLPNFLFVGARKCGSTSFYQALDRHPDVFVSNKKETKFFVSMREYMRGPTFYEARYFDLWRGEMAVGEIDPEIIDAADAPERIRSVLGHEVKLIFSFRHPVERAYSHYLHNFARLDEFDSFEQALQHDDTRTLPAFRYRWTSNYARDLERFLNVFPRENCLLLIFEELFGADRNRHFGSVLEFLGVAAADIEPTHEMTRYLPKIHVAERAGSVRGNYVDRQNQIAFGEFSVDHGDIVIEQPRIGLKVLKAPSEATRSALRRHAEIAPPLELDEGDRKRLFDTYFADYVPEFERLIERRVDLWRD